MSIKKRNMQSEKSKATTQNSNQNLLHFALLFFALRF